MNAIFKIVVAAIFVIDLALAAAGRDSFLPILRLGSYFFHAVAIAVGVFGVLEASALSKTIGRKLILLFAIISILSSSVWLYFFERDKTMMYLKAQIPSAIIANQISELSNDFLKCAKDNPPLAVNLIGGSGFIQYYSFDVSCLSLRSRIIAKRHPTEWIYFVEPPPKKM
jgi:hypothetical protein